MAFQLAARRIGSYPLVEEALGWLSGLYNGLQAEVLAQPKPQISAASFLIQDEAEEGYSRSSEMYSAFLTVETTTDSERKEKSTELHHKIMEVQASVVSDNVGQMAKAGLATLNATLRTREPSCWSRTFCCFFSNRDSMEQVGDEQIRELGLTQRSAKLVGFAREREMLVAASSKNGQEAEVALARVTQYSQVHANTIVSAEMEQQDKAHVVTHEVMLFLIRTTAWVDFVSARLSQMGEETVRQLGR